MFLGSDGMDFVRRLNILEKTFSRIEHTNKEFLRISKDIEVAEKKLSLIRNLNGNVQALLDTITTSEKQWRAAILSIIECEISKYLGYVYPEDNYTVNLSCDIKYGKIKVQATVSSNSFENLKVDTQGRLFVQIVSLATVSSIMKLKGVRTIYLDEAFSGASKENMTIMGRIISDMVSEGMNLVLIIQNEDLIPGDVDWHGLYVKRDMMNRATITESFNRGCRDE